MDEFREFIKGVTGKTVRFSRKTVEGENYMKKFSNWLLALAVVLSDVMCAVVAYNYCEMQWGAKYAMYSAPASVAFLYAIPYGIAITVCVIAAIILRKKENS